MRKKDQINIESKLKTVRFIGMYSGFNPAIITGMRFLQQRLSLPHCASKNVPKSTSDFATAQQEMSANTFGKVPTMD